MQYKIRFTKIFNKHNELRDNIIEGITEALPTEGHYFVMFGESRDKPKEQGYSRMINTSGVTRVEQPEENIYEFETQSGSQYRVEVLLDA